ncbi:methyltransferase-like protein [Heracleum sosnowskyi]|uniref:tRNA N(3)-methylcytidine methyltransferase n=1 Tax=Heracleum sosnowskyi TaxID=360622 RepID=A0AAD8I633_9APIA|nr:methyltransferase-like protein [Heracleum sosnowskyi]
MTDDAKEYHSKDFEWEELRNEIENDPSLSYHLQQEAVNSDSPSQDDSLAWNNFHTSHSTGKFFKERRYLFKEFPDLASSSLVLEVGCGNGSTALPILRATETALVFACDCSIEALERAKQNIRASNALSRFHPFYYSNADGKCCIGGVDVVTLIFTLSAVPFNRMPAAISECFSVLKPGGLLLFRDYGLYDMTMLRFEPGQKMGFREYKRSEGTRSYFFSLDSARNLFKGVGFIELELDYCCIKSVNRRNGKSMRRVTKTSLAPSLISCRE